MEQKTRDGFNEREEVIKLNENKMIKLRREKESLSKRIREYEDKKGNIERVNEDLQKQLS